MLLPRRFAPFDVVLVIVYSSRVPRTVPDTEALLVRIGSDITLIADDAALIRGSRAQQLCILRTDRIITGRLRALGIIHFSHDRVLEDPGIEILLAESQLDIILTFIRGVQCKGEGTVVAGLFCCQCSVDHHLDGHACRSGTGQFERVRRESFRERRSEADRKLVGIILILN